MARAAVVLDKDGQVGDEILHLFAVFSNCLAAQGHLDTEIDDPGKVGNGVVHDTICFSAQGFRAESAAIFMAGETGLAGGTAPEGWAFKKQFSVLGVCAKADAGGGKKDIECRQKRGDCFHTVQFPLAEKCYVFLGFQRYCTIKGYGKNERIKELVMARDEGVKIAGLTEEQGKALLWLARETIGRQLGLEAQKPGSDIAARLLDQELQHKRGTFVTLKEHGELRGCIGSLAAIDSIVEGVRRNALHAAFDDSRFRPVEKKELGAIEVEISILTDPIPLPYVNADELIRTLQVGIDGVIIRKGVQGATFLPQVWEQLPDPEDFLSHLCRKAGLAADAWRSGSIEVLTYQVQYFAELGCAAR